jgi:hypothetical protein
MYLEAGAVVSRYQSLRHGGDSTDLNRYLDGVNAGEEGSEPQSSYPENGKKLGSGGACRRRR